LTIIQPSYSGTVILVDTWLRSHESNMERGNLES